MSGGPDGPVRGGRGGANPRAPPRENRRRQTTSAPAQKTRPTTAAVCSSVLSSGDSRSTLALMIAWIESGSGRSSPCSASVNHPCSSANRTYSVTYSGLPPDRSSNVCCRSAAMAGRSVRATIRLAASSDDSGASVEVTASRRPAPQVGRSVKSSGRAVATSRMGEPAAHSMRWSRNSITASSAQCRSSMTMIKGLRAASASKKRSQAANSSWRSAPRRRPLR